MSEPLIQRTTPAARQPLVLALVLALFPAAAHAGDFLAQVEACLTDPSACPPLGEDSPLAAALNASVDDPAPYAALGPDCQEHDVCGPLAAFSAARCALQDPIGCATLSSLHESGLLEGPRPVVAAALSARACAYGHEVSCTWLALPPTIGSFGAALDFAPPPMDLVDPTRLSLLLHACDAGTPDACLALIRQLDADGPDSDARALLTQVLDDEAERGRASASDLLRTLRWLDDPLPAHLWDVAAPLAESCGRDLPRACALGRAVLHLERASGRAPPKPSLLDDTVAEPPPPPPTQSTRWVEPTLPIGVGASFSTVTPLLRLGIGVRAGFEVFEFEGLGTVAVDAARAPADSEYRRFVGSIAFGAAIPLNDRLRLHVVGGVGAGTRTTSTVEFAVGPREAIELSWLMRGRRGPTLGFRISSHQAWTLAGVMDVTASFDVVAGLRFPD